MKSNYFKQKGISGFQLLLVVLVIIFGGIFITSFASFYFAGLTWEEALQRVFQAIYLQVGIWLVLIGVGVFLVIFGITMVRFTRRRSLVLLAKVGVALICLSLLIVIVNVLLPLITNKVLTFEECKELVDVRNVYKTAACIFVGYSPTAEATVVTYVNFIIIAIIAPFVFFYYIFADLIETVNFPSNKSGQKSIAFIGAYVALRGALASYFIEFFTYGWLGMGALAFGVFMMMMAWALIRRYFEQILTVDSIRRIFEIIGEGRLATPRELILLINEARLPYTFLQRHLPDIEGVLNKLGYQSLANQIRAKMDEADEKFGEKGKIREKNQWLYQELQKLV